MNQKAVEGAMEQEAVEDGTTDGSGSNRRSNRWHPHRWIRKQPKKRWMIPPMDQGATEGTIDGSSDDQGAIERAMDGASDGSGRSRANDGWCKRWIRKQRWNRKQSTEQ